MTLTNENRQRALPSFLRSLVGSLLGLCSPALFVNVWLVPFIPFCCQDHLDLAADINVLVESTRSWVSLSTLAAQPASSFPIPFSLFLPFSPREYHGERLFLHDRKPLRTADIHSNSRPFALPTAPAGTLVSIGSLFALFFVCFACHRSIQLSRFWSTAQLGTF